jgi:hypothetical protein
MKYFTNTNGINNDQTAAMNAALVTKLEMDTKPAILITVKN